MFNDFTNKEHSKTNIKNILIDSYKLFIDENNIDIENIFNILKHEKKEHLIKSIEERNTSINDVIQNENYFLSNLDILIFSYVNKIPLVILSTLVLSESKTNFILVNKSSNDKYYFIKIIETESLLNKYRIFIYKENLIFDKKDILNTFYNTIEKTEQFDLVKYINNFKLKVKKPKFKILE